MAERMCIVEVGCASFTLVSHPFPARVPRREPTPLAVRGLGVSRLAPFHSARLTGAATPRPALPYLASSTLGPVRHKGQGPWRDARVLYQVKSHEHRNNGPEVCEEPPPPKGPVAMSQKPARIVSWPEMLLGMMRRLFLQIAGARRGCVV